MKRLSSLFLLLALFIVAPGFGQLRIEKRRYTGGWYISHASHHSGKPAANHTTVKTIPADTATQKIAAAPVRPDTLGRDTAATVAAAAPAPAVAPPVERHEAPVVAVIAPAAEKTRAAAVQAPAAMKAMGLRRLQERRGGYEYGQAILHWGYAIAFLALIAAIITGGGVLVYLAMIFDGFASGCLIGIFLGLGKLLS